VLGLARLKVGQTAANTLGGTRRTYVLYKTMVEWQANGPNGAFIACRKELEIAQVRSASVVLERCCTAFGGSSTAQRPQSIHYMRIRRRAGLADDYRS